MKKFSSISAGTMLLILLIASTSQLISIKAAKADTEASAVFRSTGGLWWFEDVGWPNEDDVSYDVSIYVYGLFGNPPYDHRYYGNSGAVTKTNILNHIDDYNEDDYATFFIFANGANYTDYDRIYYLPTMQVVASYPVTHYAFYDSYDASIKDQEIGALIYGGSYLRFVFLWTCAQGSEIGSLHGSYWYSPPDYWFEGSQATGMPYAWTYRDYTQMNSDGYGNPDTGSYCFIGFEGFGVPLSEVIPDSGGKNYGDFVEKFYYHALVNGYKINRALDEASDYVWDEDYDETPLHDGYSYNLPGLGWWDGWMRVYGNGNNTLPN